MELIKRPCHVEVFNPEHLIPHEKNDYFFPRMDDDDEFIKSIRERGVVDMPLVSEKGVIVSGHRRIRGAILCGYEQIQCQVRDYEGNDDMVLYDMIVSNIMSRGGLSGLTTIYVSRVVSELRRLYGNRRDYDNESPIGVNKSVPEMCAELGMSRSAIGRIDKIAHVTDDVAEQLKSRVSATGLEMLGELSSEDQRRVADGICATEGKVTVDDVRRIIEENEKMKQELDTRGSEIKELERKLERMVMKVDQLEESKGIDDEIEVRLALETDLKKYKAEIANLRVLLQRKENELQNKSDTELQQRPVIDQEYIETAKVSFASSITLARIIATGNADTELRKMASEIARLVNGFTQRADSLNSVIA